MTSHSRQAETLVTQIGWNDVTHLWSQHDRHFVGQDHRTVRS